MFHFSISVQEHGCVFPSQHRGYAEPGSHGVLASMPCIANRSIIQCIPATHLSLCSSYYILGVLLCIWCANAGFTVLLCYLQYFSVVTCCVQCHYVSIIQLLSFHLCFSGSCIEVIYLCSLMLLCYTYLSSIFVCLCC